MHALVDGDILVYRVGFTTQEKDPSGNLVPLPEGIACARMRETLDTILGAVNPSEYTVYLTSTDKSNYRYQIYPEYKANRKAPKPLLYDLLRDYLIETRGALVIQGQEADDAIGIRSRELGESSIICSIDKDLDQLPGKHYNFVKGLLYHVTPEEGLKFFYHQLLMGDRTDNIPGIPGIGEVKSTKALARAATEPHLFGIAKQMYQAAFPQDWEALLRRNGRLLKIRQHEDELWDFPVEENYETQPVEAV